MSRNFTKRTVVEDNAVELKDTIHTYEIKLNFPKQN
jgi:hypothetical protein